MRRHVTTAILLLWFSLGYAQETTVIDSLSQRLSIAESVMDSVDVLNALADHYSDNDSSLTYEHAGLALHLARQAEYSKGIVDANFHLGWLNVMMANYDISRDLFNESFEIAVSAGYREGEANAYKGLGELHYNKGNFDSSGYYHRRALGIYQDLGDGYGIASSLNNIGVMHKTQGDYDSALWYYRLSAQGFQDMNDLKSWGGNLINIGVIHANQGNYSLALDFFLQGRKIYERINDLRILTIIYGNIGALYELQGDFAKAKAFQLMSVAICVETGNMGGLALAYNNLGNLYQYGGFYDSALFYYAEANSIIVETDDDSERGNNILNLGITYLRMGDYARAETNLREANRLLQQTGEEALRTEALVFLGETLFNQGKRSEAVQRLTTGIEMAQDIGYVSSVRDGAEIISRIFAETGKYQNAYTYHVLFKEMTDSLVNAENIRRITQLESEYEYGKREEQLRAEKQRNEYELESRNRRNVTVLYGTIGVAVFLVVVSGLIFYQYRQRSKYANLVEQQNVQLSEVMAAKEKIFGVIAHDLKNPLSAFGNMSATLAENITSFSKEEIKSFLEKFVKSTTDLHDLLNNLLQWSLTETGMLQVKPETVEVSKLAHEAIQPLRDYAQAKGITLKLDVVDDQTIVDKQMIETVIRNLVSNALKFTDKGGEVQVKTERLKELINVQVIDNGVGMTEEELKHLFDIKGDISKVGDHEEKGTGIGLILCKELVEKNNGDIRVESVSGKGSVFSFTLPVAA